MLKKHFHKLLLLFTTLGITSLQAAQQDEGKNDHQEKAIGYYNYTLKHSKKKIDNTVARDELEDEKEDLKNNHITEALADKKAALFVTLIVSSKKKEALYKFFFINRDPNIEKKAIRKSERSCACHVTSHTTPILSPHLIFQVLGWLQQNSSIYTPVFMHASGPLCITCNAIVRNLFNLNMPTNPTGCSGASDVELEKECPLAQKYIKSRLTLALAKKILLPQVKYHYESQLKTIKKHLFDSTFIGHTNGVSSVAVTDDNRLMVSGSYDKTIRIWDFKTGKEVSYSPLTGHTGAVRSVAISADNRYIVSGSYGKTIRIWDFKTGKEMNYSPLKGHTGDVRSVAVTKDNQYIVSGSNDHTIRIWDLKTGKEVSYSPLTGHTNYVFSVALTNDNKYIVSGGDNSIRIWDFKTGEELSYSPFTGHTNVVFSVAVTRDNKYIISGSADQTIRIWDFKTGKEVNYSPLKGHTNQVYSVEVTGDSPYIISASQDNTIRIWDFKTGKQLSYSPLIGHTDYVLSVAATSDSKYIISGSQDKTIRIWDFKLLNKLIAAQNIAQDEHKEEQKEENNDVDNEVFDLD